MTEFRFEDQVVRYVEDTLGGWAPKLVIKNQRHFPDRTLILPEGRVCFVELKRPGGGGVKSAGQRGIVRRLQSLGHAAGFADNWNDVKRLIEEAS